MSFDVNPGEIVGLYGLVGSGRSSVARTITGQRRGRQRDDQAPRRRRSSCPLPAAAVAKRIAYLTEDRRLEGFVKDFDNGQNMSLVVLPRMARAGVVHSGAEKKRVRELIGEYQVKGGTKTYTRTLSGGNQQKVVVAKWLETDPDFVVLDEPTKGIDVGARANIYEIIHSRRRPRQGRAGGLQRGRGAAVAVPPDPGDAQRPDRRPSSTPTRPTPTT